MSVHDDEATVDQRWIPLAKIGRPHGVRGEVKVRLFNPESIVLFEQDSVRLQRKGVSPQQVTIVGARPAADLWIVHFEGVEDREAAAALTHGQLAVPRSVLPLLEDGEFYHVDVVGARVWAPEGEVPIGKVRYVHDSPSELLEVRLTDGADVLIPLQAPHVLMVEPGRVVIRDIEDWRP